ncbi:MAG: porin [Nitrospirota bacterium]
MKKSIITGFAAVALLAGQIAGANAADVSGYANIWTILSSDTASTSELKTSVGAEVDFEKTMGKSNVRLDVDFGKSTSVEITDSDGDTADFKIESVSIEQAKLTQQLHSSISLTAGRFNSPIGFEKQDAPDKWQFSNGQLFDGRPSNLDGFMVSWWGSGATLDVMFANDWRGQADAQTDFDNSVGVRGSVQAGPVNIALGYLSSDRDENSPSAGDDPDSGDLVNAVITGSHGSLTGVFEYLKDDDVDAWGLTGHYKHGVHGVLLRYDSVDPEDAAFDESTSLTVGLSCKMWESVTTKLEWRQDDEGGDDDKTDQLTIQWVGSF